MRFVKPLCVLTLTAMLATCGGDTVVEPPADVELNISLNVQATAITAVVIEVSGPGIPSTIAFNLTVIGGVASGTIILPAGTDRVVVVRGFDSSGIETHRGTATLDVLTSSNPTLNLTMLPLTGGVPVVITIGSYGVSITPLDTTVAQNDTVRLTATVTDGSAPLDVSPVWASLNPIIATVDAEGLVRGLGVGEVTIVASYGGVAAASQIQVIAGGGGGATYPGCMDGEEIALIVQINAARAGAPLIVDTRLIQLARLNTQRVRDEPDLDSLAFSGYGLTASYIDFGFGFFTSAGLWDAWLGNMTPQRQAGFAIMLGADAHLIGVSRDLVAGPTLTPRWSITVSTSTAEPIQDGSCFP